jgi:hypothetical protein
MTQSELHQCPQELHPQVAILHCRHAGLHGGPTNLDKPKTKVPDSICNPIRHDANGGYLTATTKKYKNNNVNKVMQIFKIQLYQAALPSKLQNVVAQKDQTTIILDNVYGIATTTLSESSSKASTAVTAIKEDKGFNKLLVLVKLLVNKPRIADQPQIQHAVIIIITLRSLSKLPKQSFI